MAEVVKTAARNLPAFRLGEKKVFLPNHVITFLRKDYLPLNEACFQVPLTFTKFDLRDYLWNVYNVEVTKVRSYVKELPLTQRHANTRSSYRPLPLKVMTVQLVQPFQWPEKPTDLEPWYNTLWRTREKMSNKHKAEQTAKQESKIPLMSRKPYSKERKLLADLAKKMQSGEVKWSNDLELDPRWDTLLAKEEKPAKAETEIAKVD
ncbi:hypothetical protein E4U17_000380 [Claviceps sp. LM77 group G4]|nr:hypothetical protein E4U17_000380 [Claviceps sp. LM77 group G4]KAG6052701.1 hypothetical protein E4U33_000409 [Claviceps sp. LM78 group G4]KAG6082316.1 hypothetical protein E4U16_006262 [Claviceps sp. LM84 group G4]